MRDDDDNMEILEALEEANIPYHTGEIVGFSGSWGSGIGFLSFRDEEGGEHSIPCDNGPTVRALDAAFGDIIAPGHTVDCGALEGKRVAWWLDDMGLMLGGFAPLAAAA